MTVPVEAQYRDFAAVYDRWLPHPERDLAFWERRAREAGGTVVELGVGTGRLAVPLAQAGIRVVGVDASDEMLARAREKAEAAGVLDRVELVRGDFRTFAADPPVELVILAANSFLHLVTTDDQAAALGSVHRSLRPAGRFVTAMFVPDPHLMAQRDGRRNLQAEFDDDGGARVQVWATPTYEITSQLIHERVEVERYEGERLVGSTAWDLELRMVYRYEMEHLLARSGFAVETVYGDFDDGPLTEEKRTMIWVARKR